MEYGYPEARAENVKADIIDLLELSSELASDDTNNSFARVGNDVSDANGCFVQYNEPNAPSAPSEFEYSIEIVTTGH